MILHPRLRHMALGQKRPPELQTLGLNTIDLLPYPIYRQMSGESALRVSPTSEEVDGRLAPPRPAPPIVEFLASLHSLAVTILQPPRAFAEAEVIVFWSWGGDGGAAGVLAGVGSDGGDCVGEGAEVAGRGWWFVRRYYGVSAFLRGGFRAPDLARVVLPVLVIKNWGVLMCWGVTVGLLLLLLVTGVALRWWNEGCACGRAGYGTSFFLYGLRDLWDAVTGPTVRAVVSAKEAE